MTSSPISWTGNGSTFSLIGYSLGGGISVDFTSYFPSLVSSLVLLAPAGLVREDRLTFTNKFLYNTGLISEKTLENVVRRRLQRGDPPVKAKEVSSEAPVTEELPKEKLGAVPQAPVLSRARPGITVANIIVSSDSPTCGMPGIHQSKQAWQVDVHEGFIKSFISSLRYGPIVGQHADWRRIGERLSAQNASTEARFAERGLQNGKVLIICGSKDALIVQDELVPDATDVLGANNVEFEFFDAGHELPVTKGEQIVNSVWEFWQRM